MRYLCLLLLGGCSILEPKVVEVPAPPPVIIHPAAPQPVSLEAPKFFVLTRDNIDEFFEKEKEPVIFAVTTEGYESLSVNIQELRRYIVELQNMVLYYKTSIDASNKSE